MDGSQHMDKRIHRGLVIAGGGAKGAYSFGALKALHESGIEFEAVSATSAGALNGAIWATGQVAAGENLWRQMSSNNTYQFHAALKRLPPNISRLPFLLISGFSLIANRVWRGVLSAELERPVTYAAVFLAWIIGTIVFALSSRHESLSTPVAYSLLVMMMPWLFFPFPLLDETALLCGVQFFYFLFHQSS